MFCHGSYLLNLRAMDLFGGRLGDEGPVERLVPAPPDDLVRGFFDLLERDTSKHAFLPEAWPLAEDAVVAHNEEEDVDAEDDEEETEDDEEVGDDDAGPSYLVPLDWRTVLSGTAKWKCNALNFMKQQYDVAVKNHVLIHLKTDAHTRWSAELRTMLAVYGECAPGSDG